MTTKPTPDPISLRRLGPSHLSPARTPIYAALLRAIDDNPDRVPCINPPSPGLDWLDPRQRIQDAAARLCRRCPALEQCAAFYEPYPAAPGVVYGTTERQRTKGITTTKAER
ncbi:hypothetical protein D6T63_05655 [Arthrobacter cheniae]|uniref:4Fe-4S Wbl-type domain-containing protein n=1 Tax=Arthrobacter cheniae TaxID=1258888 RepID=A0A3A5MHV9_9MICC|nr:WhiB family transcriptional regulator [Arthrobacter cheniae]RJT82206.1 hypothetical protein D6T63_05655 [Arthrobacter cheniae]